MSNKLEAEQDDRDKKECRGKKWGGNQSRFRRKLQYYTQNKLVRPPNLSRIITHLLDKS